MATLPRLKPRMFYDLVVEVALIRPGSDPGRLRAPLHPAPQRAGTGHLRPPVDGAGAAEDPGRAAVPGAADATCGRLRGLLRGRGRPAAPGHGLQAIDGEDAAAAGPVLRRHAQPARHHRRRGRPDLREAGGLRQFRLSPRATHCASRRWCSTRRGSSCITPPRSARRCCGPSRWASTHRSRWSPTPAGTASRCTGRTSTPAWRTPTLENAETRSGSGSVRSATSATSWRSAWSTSERPTGRSYSLLDLTGRLQLTRSADRGAGDGRRAGLLRDHPPRGAVGGGCGGRRAARSAARRGDVVACAGTARDERGGAGRRRRLGHRRLTGQLSHAVPAGRPRRARGGACRPAAVGARRHPDPGGRGGDPPAAAGDRAGRDVHQPRGRDGHGQRPVFTGGVGAASQTGADGFGVG